MAASGINVAQSWANIIVGLDDTTYYAVNQTTGALVTTGSSYAVVYAAALAALTSGNGVIIDKSGQQTPNPKIRRYASSVLSEETTNLLSAGFAIDSTGVKTVTTAHALTITPSAKDVSLTVIEDTDVDDWAYGFVKVESVNATNVVAKVNVTTASATGSATAKLGIKIDVR